MARILTYHNPSSKELKQNPLKSLFEQFKSLDRFTRAFIIVVLVTIAATPFVVSQYQTFTSRGQIDLGKSGTTDENGVFREYFVFKGNHAATINSGAGSTVWLNTDLWDARGDTASNNQEGVGLGHYIDIQNSSLDLRDGGRENNKYEVSGDGSSGALVMHTDSNSIVSARLRNPIVISQTLPGVVEFRATKFVTTGHWWEIAITPTNIVRGAESTAISTQAKSQPEDSINLTTIGSSDTPCDSAWNTLTRIEKSINGTKTSEIGTIMPKYLLEKDKLYEWRLDY